VLAGGLLAIGGCGGGDDDQRGGYVSVPAPDDATPVANPATLPPGFAYFDDDQYWAVSKVSETTTLVASLDSRTSGSSTCRSPEISRRRAMGS